MKFLKKLFKQKDNCRIIYWCDTHQELDIKEPVATTSMICNQSFFDMPFFQYWAEKIHMNFVDLMVSTNQLTPDALQQKVVYHRKLWEFVYICQGLFERGFLKSEMKGMTFGVGTECLPDLFASMGCRILATDLDMEEAKEKGWVDGGQHIGIQNSVLNKYHFCDEKTFNERVSFRYIDMNEIPKDVVGYDFVWSACALEHLGSIEKGLDFIKNSLNVLKSGGVAIHTTEFNLSSDEETLQDPNCVIFRKQDILKVVCELEGSGHYVYPIDWHTGEGIADMFVDLPPYSKKDLHLRLNLAGFNSTSIGLIIRKK